MGIKEFYNSIFDDGSRMCPICEKGFMPTYDQICPVACYECEKEAKKEIGCFDKYEGPYMSGVASSNYISPSGVYFNFYTSDCGPR